MDGSTGPPSDVKAMGSENDEGSKVRGGNTDDSAATSIPSPTSSTTSSSSSLTSSYPMIQTDSEYHAGGSIRADSLFPIPTTSSSPPGRGCVAATVIESDEITMTITPTTGGQFDLTVDRMDTVENLKKIISKRLKVAKERICLLHRERQLREGTLEENGLQDGNRLTLLPSVETGLLAQRPEQSVMQALESLNDSQVNDFLSGKAPLNLTMRLGDHMMLIQLQLSTVTPASASTNQTSNSTSGLTIGGSSTTGTNVPTSNVSSSLQSRRSTVLAARSTTSISTKLQNSNVAPRTTSLIDSLASALHADPHCLPRSSFCNCQTQSTCGTNHSESVSPVNSFNACPFCLLHRHHRRPHRHHRHHRHHHHHYHHHSRNKPPLPTSMSQFFSSSINKLLQSTSTTGHGCTDSSMPYNIILPRKKLCTAHHHPQPSTSGTDSSRSSTTTQDGDSSPQSPTSPLADQTMKTATLDTRALAEASRNLTQKLKQLSSEVLTSRVDLAEENARRRQGAIIESMHHHGKGVYSGTFSGTLNPALQDRLGRPKRDISTIIHILNDLLCATPAATAGHYRHHHRHSNGRQQSSPSTSTTGTTTSTNGTTTPIGCQDTSAPGYSSEELSKENEATKGKMRHLRLVMEQRRAKRKARRLARAAPFTTQWAAVTPDPNTSASSSSATGTNAAEPQNEPELQPCSPEPVVA